MQNCPREFEDHSFLVTSIKLTEENEHNYYLNSIDIALTNIKYDKFACSKASNIKANFASKVPLKDAILDVRSGLKEHKNLLIRHNRSGFNYIAKKVSFYYKNVDSDYEKLKTELINKEGSLMYNDSPYVVRLLHLFNSNMDFLWLTFELCIGNLEDYFEMNKMSLKNLSKKYFDGEPVTEHVVNHFQIEYGIDLTRICWIYAFEIMNILDYLAHRNIVHGNINSKTIFIDERGHLKISDLGYNDRFRWEERMETGSISIRNKMELEENDFNHYNLYYADTEIILSGNGKAQINEWLNANGFHCVLYNMSSMDSQPQSFMSDAYAAAILIIEIFMGGFSVTNSVLLQQSHRETFKFTDLTDDLVQKIWTIFLTYHSDVNMHILSDLLKSSDPSLRLHTLINGFCKGRNDRFLEFTASKTVNLNGRSVNTNFINIDEITKLTVFQTFRINTVNVRSLYIDVNFTKNLVKYDNRKINLDGGCFDSDKTDDGYFTIIPLPGLNNVFEYS